MAIPTVEATVVVATRQGRMRAAIIVDIVVGLATIPLLGAAMPLLVESFSLVDARAQHRPPWWVLLLLPTIMLILAGGVVAVSARLVARGQMPGLAMTGLRWADDGGRPAWRRLLAEPQLWCAVLPAVWIVLNIPPNTIRFFVPLSPFWAGASAVQAAISPALLLCALACMVVSHRYPGRLAPRV